MIRSSSGQWNSEVAADLYRSKRAIVNALVKGGKILASEADTEWAKRVSDHLERLHIPVSKDIVTQAGFGLAASASVEASAPTVLQGAAPVANVAIRASAGQVARNVFRGGWLFALAGVALEGANTTYKYRTGKIDAAEAKRRMVKSAASNGGGLSGAAAGAAIGTVFFPGIGTVVGTMVGGFAGAIGSGRLAKGFV